MSAKSLLGLLLAGWQIAAIAAPLADSGKPAPVSPLSGLMINWGLGLLVVLAIFLVCATLLRRLNAVSLNGSEKMRIVGGLALGMREKVVLVQLGKKQALLAVTPGRIQLLHLLEGDACLNQDQPDTPADGGFSKKLLQALQARVNA